MEEPALVDLRSVYRIRSTGKRIPVSVKLGQHYVQIMTRRKQKIIEGASSPLVDVYAISDIEDIFLGLTADAETDFRFRTKKKSTPIMCSTTSAIDANRFVFVSKVSSCITWHSLYYDIGTQEYEESFSVFE